MKKFNVSAIFSIKDKISNPVKKIAQSVKGLDTTVTKTNRKVKSFGSVSPFKKMSFGVKNLKGNMRDLTGSIRGVSGAMTGMLGALAVGGLVSVGRNALNTADNFRKMSERVGVSVEDLSLLSIAAAKSDIDLAVFSGGLRRFNKRTVDALNDTGEAIKGFEALGIGKGDIVNKTQIERMELIANAVEKMTDKQKASRAVQRIMGDESVKFFNLFENGWKGVTKEMEHARKLGGLITTEDAKKAEVFNDRLTDVGTIFSGLTRSLTADLLPSFSKIVVKTTDWITKNKDLTKSIVKVIGGVLAVGAGFAALSVAGMALGSVISMVKSLSFAVLGLGKIFLFNPIGLAITGIVAGTVLLYKTWEPATKFFDGIFNSITTSFQKFKNILMSDGLSTATYETFGKNIIASFERTSSYFSTEFPALTNLFNKFTTFLGTLEIDTEFVDSFAVFVKKSFKSLGHIIHLFTIGLERTVSGWTSILDGTFLDLLIEGWKANFNNFKVFLTSVFDGVVERWTAKFNKIKSIFNGVKDFLGFGNDKDTKVSATKTIKNITESISTGSAISKPIREITNKIPNVYNITNNNSKSLQSVSNTTNKITSPISNITKPILRNSIPKEALQLGLPKPEPYSILGNDSNGQRQSLLGPQKIESKNQIDVTVTDKRIDVATSTPSSTQTKSVFNVGQNRIGGFANAF